MHPPSATANKLLALIGLELAERRECAWVLGVDRECRGQLRSRFSVAPGIE